MKITIHVPVREIAGNGMTSYEMEPRECEVVAVVRHEHSRRVVSHGVGWMLRGPAIAWTYMVDVVHPGWKPPEGFPEGKPGCVFIKKPSEVSA